MRPLDRTPLGHRRALAGTEVITGPRAESDCQLERSRVALRLPVPQWQWRKMRHCQWHVHWHAVKIPSRLMIPAAGRIYFQWQPGSAESPATLPASVPEGDSDVRVITMTNVKSWCHWHVY